MTIGRYRLPISRCSDTLYHMQRYSGLCTLIAIICTSCGDQSAAPAREASQTPDWTRYRAPAATVPTGPSEPRPRYRPGQEDRFSFRDLKTESDEGLARRLLGEVGRRIAYIDRHRERWSLYNGDDDGAENLDLYTHPVALGSQFGLCGVERYAIEFNDAGHIESVTVSQRYGVEGPIFEQGDYESDRYRVMCASASATHAPSYFPAGDSIKAYEAAHLLLGLVDQAASPGTLAFPLQCRTWNGQACSQNVRAYLGGLRLGDIDEFSLINCPLGGAPEGTVCFTIKTDEFRVGPFPKYVTVRGSRHGNVFGLDSVEVLESQTVS